jgi:DNA-binding response OmpR family regulator/HPt (histidine-containing phosphotransfer) domain-containing protein
MKLLLIEDDESIIAALSHNLMAHHYVVDAVTDGETGWTYATTFEYDLIVLDIMLPKMDGIHFCECFREEGYTTPILFLTAQDRSMDKVRGLDAGADDYVVKPFDIDELSARIRALLRRGKASPFPLLMWEDLTLNPSTFEVTYQDKPLVLSIKEYELLELFLRDCRHVFSSDEILDKLWTSEEFPVEATVRSHIRHLRNKLTVAGAPHDFISTIHGRGYYLKPISQELSSPATEASSDGRRPVGEPHTSKQQEAYSAFLNETWVTTQPRCLEQLALIADVLQTFPTESLDAEQQQQALQIAHKLVGTLGIFDLTEGARLARELEQLFQSPLHPQQLSTLEALLLALTQEVQQTTSIELCQAPAQYSPLVWLIAPETTSTQALAALTTCSGIRLASIAPSLQTATAQLGKTITLDTSKQPDVILVQLPSINSASVSPLPETDWTALHELTQQYPDSPVLLMGRDLALADRLTLLSRGNRILVESSSEPDIVLKAVQKILNWNDRNRKVMIVDDDLTWLQALPTLLTPWGFNVSTLAEPTQFWSVLEAVKPDALVLDVKMPDINGLELCQILRRDVRWQQLPILFLSAMTDPNIQQDAFTAGADDYLVKPVVGAELAHRIRNRLQRTWN